MDSITQKEAKKFIEAEAQKIFSVTFEKKDGSIRDMVCRRGVHKGVKGVGMNYDPAEHQLVTVYDMHKSAFRMIPLDRLKRVKIDGVDYQVVQDEAKK